MLFKHDYQTDETESVWADRAQIRQDLTKRKVGHVWIRV